jgi:hypothetical protein
MNGIQCYEGDGVVHRHQPVSWQIRLSYADIDDKDQGEFGYRWFQRISTPLASGVIGIESHRSRGMGKIYVNQDELIAAFNAILKVDKDANPVMVPLP